MDADAENVESLLILECIDTHTGGEPTRVVLSGIPSLQGVTSREQREDLKSRVDWLRQLVVAEPRGHADMFGAIVLDEHKADTDLGLIFIDNDGYLDMCGHGLIGAVTALAESDRLPHRDRLLVDTPAGTTECQLKRTGRHSAEVTFVNVPAFVCGLDCTLDVGGRSIEVDVSYGGNFFVLVQAEHLDLRLDTVPLSEIRELGMDVLRAAQRNISVQHSKFGPSTIQLVEFWESLGARSGRNIVVFGKGQIDRSPCGTGTCARLAVLHARGQIGVGDEYEQIGPVGSSLIARISGEVKIGEFRGVIPEITGEAHVTGYNRLIASRRDPFALGLHI
ncbi:MAG: proline racemase family protein [Thermoplasmata archaeon]